MTEAEPSAEGPPNPPAVAQGLGSFVKPTKVMRPNLSYQLEFIVAANEQALAAAADTQETEAPKSILVAPVMKVKLLENPNFKIDPPGWVERQLGLAKAATWDWNVVPMRPGNYVLKAQVRVVVNGSDQELPEKTVPVVVKVGWWDAFLTGIGNATTLGGAMEGLFKSWRSALVAFFGFLGILLLVLWRLGIIKKKPEPVEPPPS